MDVKLKMPRYCIGFCLFILLTPGCSGPVKSDSSLAVESVPIRESFRSPEFETANIDSLAFWIGNPNRIIVTAKGTHELLLLDPLNGQLVLKTGSPGSEPGQFQRPNGILIIDDLIFVVERDNHRLQVLSLPHLETLSIFGESILVRPYGITGYRSYVGTYEIFLTDNFENPEISLDNRIRHFRLVRNGEEFVWEFVRSFGDRKGPGVLTKVETLVIDAEMNRLLIAEEAEKKLKIYDLDGQFTGQLIGQNLFQFEPEGIALRTGEGIEYWIMTDQDINSNTFLLVSRDEFELIGKFNGPATRNTDGVAIVNQSIEGFPKGAFFAVDNDLAVTGFDLDKIDQVVNRHIDRLTN
jgi:3-phytase